jgi:hypothetical protein
MDHDHFGDRVAGWPLRMDENAHAGLGVIEFGFHWELFGVDRPAPVIAGDGEEMGVLEERDEGSQNTILEVKKKGRTRRPP